VTQSKYLQTTQARAHNDTQTDNFRNLLVLLTSRCLHPCCCRIPTSHCNETCSLGTEGAQSNASWGDAFVTFTTFNFSRKHEQTSVKLAGFPSHTSSGFVMLNAQISSVFGCVSFTHALYAVHNSHHRKVITKTGANLSVEPHLLYRDYPSPFLTGCYLRATTHNTDHVHHNILPNSMTQNHCYTCL
jgi:hypothetical protein